MTTPDNSETPAPEALADARCSPPVGLGETCYINKSPKPLILKAIGQDMSLLMRGNTEYQVYNADIYATPYKQRVDKTLIALLPKGSYNIGISLESTIYADSNDSANWWRLAIPLPKPRGEWKMVKEIETTDGISITLADSF